MKARLIDTDGKDTIIEPENGKNFSLQELYKLLDCDTVQLVVLPNSGKYMIMDEEGKLRGKAINSMATILYNNPRDHVVGKVVVCERTMFK